MFRNRYFWLLISLFFVLKTEAKVTLTSIWGDNMVLQQQAEVTFRGKATPGKRVYASASWNHRKIYADCDRNGQWTLALPTPEAGGPYTITFSDGEELTLKNILIGEVWFCSGQSNMEMPVKGFRGQPVYGSQPYIVSANPKRPLRLYTVKNNWSTTPKEEGIDGQWSEASSEEVADFSATAYFFGNLLQQSLDVPVGLIHCSWSMSKIEAWMDKETLSHFSEVTLPDTNQDKFEWAAGTPTLLWNAMVNPWKGFPVKGVIWYQGEANTPDPALYKKLFPAMVSQWRNFFHNAEMPFYYVQIAPHKYGNSRNINSALLQEAQMKALQTIPNSGMIPTIDVGDEFCIHPPQKNVVGLRLANLALTKTYGLHKFPSTGPMMTKVEYSKNKAIVTLDNAPSGLAPGNCELEGFEIAGADKKFYPAKARIAGRTRNVEVWSDQVAQPVAVRYAFRNYVGNITLRNTLGIAAFPFRTDTWDDVK